MQIQTPMPVILMNNTDNKEHILCLFSYSQTFNFLLLSALFFKRLQAYAERLFFSQVMRLLPSIIQEKIYDIMNTAIKLATIINKVFPLKIKKYFMPFLFATI